MAVTEVERKRERVAALRAVRRIQRQADSSIERLERRIFRLLDRKTIITMESAETLVPLYNSFYASARELEGALTDFLIIVSQS